LWHSLTYVLGVTQAKAGNPTPDEIAESDFISSHPALAFL
jgi:hypothetical protein